MSSAIRQNLLALVRHYRHHPLQALFLLTGITVANVLLVGTLLINAQARSSYDEGTQVLQAGPVGMIRPADGSRTLHEDEYFRLRLAGHTTIIPVLNRTVRTSDGALIELLGIDPLALSGMPRTGSGSVPTGLSAEGFGSFIARPWQLWASPQRIRQGGWTTGEQLRLGSGELLPPLQSLEDAGLGHRMLVDIGALQELTDSPGQLSAIWVFERSGEQLDDLLDALPSDLRYVANTEQPDPTQLTRSFHLNLTAMGLLTFVVGMFLIYNAVAFSFTDRENLISKLRLSGATHREIIIASSIELSVFLIAGLALGYWLGGLIAGFLLPGVGQTLAQLYGVYIAYQDRLLPSAALLPFAMTVFAGGLCLWVSLSRTLKAPLLPRHSAGWSTSSVRSRDSRWLIAGLVLLILSWLLGATAANLVVALIGMAALLLGTALTLPWLLRLALYMLAKRLPRENAGLSWVVADSQWLLGPAALALMAMVLALVANHGLNTMISSFRMATDNWLGERLVADVYYGRSGQSAEARYWLDENYSEIRIVERLGVRTNRLAPGDRSVPVEIVSLPDDPRFRDSVVPMQSRLEAVDQMLNGESVLISERAWRIEGWKIGQQIELCPDSPGIEIAGIYHDYGNPVPQWMISDTLFRQCWPDATPSGFALLGPEITDWEAVRLGLSDLLEVDADAFIPQGDLRQVGLAVFDRTFQVTQALNALTLLVAAIGIFCAISAIHHHRVAQQAQLACLGLGRRKG